MISKEIRHATLQDKACDIDYKKQVCDDQSKSKDIKNSLLRFAVIVNKYFDIYMVHLPLLVKIYYCWYFTSIFAQSQHPFGFFLCIWVEIEQG